MMDRTNNTIMATLRWCNDRRLDKGLNPLDDLPLGSRSDPLSCPCGKATGLWVGLNTWNEVGLTNPMADGKPLPPEVRKFVTLFDDGLIPEYDEEED